jgi:hypothetical protein
MKDQHVYRDCFFTKSPEAFTKIKRLKEDYDDVTIENFPVTTEQDGMISITVVHFSSPKKSELFSEEECEEIINGTYQAN